MVETPESLPARLGPLEHSSFGKGLRPDTAKHIHEVPDHPGAVIVPQRRHRTICKQATQMSLFLTEVCNCAEDGDTCWQLGCVVQVDIEHEAASKDTVPPTCDA